MAITEEISGDLRPGRAFTVFGLLALLSMVPLLVEHGGFELSPAALAAVRAANLLFVLFFLLEFLLVLRASADLRSFARREAAELVLLAGLLVALLLALLHPLGFFRLHGLEGYVVPAQAYLVLNLILKLLQLFQVATRLRFHYARAFGVSFLAIIAVGTAVLYLLPGTKAPGRELSFVDALFTATSATCVTGLVTVDTGTHFSRFGQTVILTLFQVGGLGLMTFAAFFAIALGKGMGMKDRNVMMGVLNLDVMGRIVRVIVGILAITVILEVAGAVLLYGRWTGDLAPHDRLFTSVFHSVSAFCNAGFSLTGDSFTGYAGDPVLNGTVMALIVVGGLGFGVLLELLGLAYFRIQSLRKKGAAGPAPRLSVQSRIVLLASLVLTVGGAGLLYLFEAGNPETLGGLPAGERVTAAAFQSITTRTAGFNTVPIGELTDQSQFLMVALMMVGASPGSTGGGLKTVTAVVLLLTVIALIRGREGVEVYRRSIPASTVSKAVIIVITAIAVVFFATLLLTAVEGGRFRFLSIFFEVGSAFGTVGLSTGITPELSALSKLVLSAVMLVGRIGPLSLVIALGQAALSRKYELPEENVMIG